MRSTQTTAAGVPTKQEQGILMKIAYNLLFLMRFGLYSKLSPHMSYSKNGTQNTNESFHNLIWTRCPNTVFVSKKHLEIAVDDATIVFNDSERRRLSIFQKLGLSISPYNEHWVQSKDKRRVKRAYIRTADTIKKRRKMAQETSKQWDSSSYEPGNV
ncbi:hypothetical protein PoB_001329200 [Plakobranchus ocellatus]|uniref:Uncharacterized protein n=1 Tax=Plakobranchus ocellatus TaxID=259542 RepID=A0AAV3YWQ7_9GAST|nr:hypothetical protein PoB_001329200 [Plakobranchus ocellatus]